MPCVPLKNRATKFIQNVQAVSFQNIMQRCASLAPVWNAKVIFQISIGSLLTRILVLFLQIIIVI